MSEGFERLGFTVERLDEGVCHRAECQDAITTSLGRARRNSSGNTRRMHSASPVSKHQ